MTDTPLPLDEAAAKIQRAREEVFGLCDGKRKWTMRVPVDRERDSDCVICDALDVADALRARVAELEAHANRLRDALVKGNYRLGYWCDLHGSLPDDRDALGVMQAALASTPAASLAAVRASVWEAAAKKCDEREEIYQGEAEACESNGEEADGFESLRDECAGLANVFRALAAQEVTE